MGKRIFRNEECCPECGHLLPKKKWECQFCGWTLNESANDAMIQNTAGFDFEEDCADIDQFIDKINADYPSTST